MAAKSWRLVVTVLGGSTPLSEAHVEAGNWMTALTLARKEVGETGGVPPGGSCSVAPDGKVTIHDAVQRRTYVLSPLSESPPSTRPPKMASEPAPRPTSQPPGALKVPRPSDRPPAPDRGKVSTSTIAYDAKDLGIALPLQAAAPPEPSKKRAVQSTVSFDSSQLGMLPPAPQEEPKPPEESKKKKKKAPQNTVAFDVSQLPFVPPQAPPAEAAKPADAKRALQQTVAFDSSQFPIAPPPQAQPEAPRPEENKKRALQQTVSFDSSHFPIAPPQQAQPQQAQPQQAQPQHAQPAPRSEPPKPEADKKRALQQTVSFDSSHFPIAPPQQSQPQQAQPQQAQPQAPVEPKIEEPKPKKKKPQHTVAFDVSELGIIPPAQPAQPAVPPTPASGMARQPVPEAPPPEPERPTIPEDLAKSDHGGWELIHGRDEDPSPENPLLYRERTYYVPPELGEDHGRAVMMARFEDLRVELADRSKGKLVNMAVFDHRFVDRPTRPPLFTLQWKDWRGEPVITRGGAQPRSVPPQSAPAPSAPAPSASPPAQRASSPPVAVRQSAPPAEHWSAPPAAVAPAPEPGPPSDELDLTISEQVIDASGRRTMRVAGDDALSAAFEALQDLFFLATPIEGLEFVIKLLEDLVPSECVSACLYDINTDEFRFVALTGPGAAERQGEAVPRITGLLGAAAQTPSEALLIDHVAYDRRFDPGIDGRLGVDPRTMALVAIGFQGRLLGMLQLINRKHEDAYSRSDANLLAYVGEKLGEFLHSARMRPQERS